LLLLGMGFDGLSMNAPSLPRVRAAIRRVSLAAAQGLVSEVLCQPTANQVHGLLLERMQAWELAHLLPPRDHTPDASAVQAAVSR
jgi:phosphotransferase system enzyme I (PtsP)